MRSAIRLIAAKELLDTLRDRRTLFVALVLPLLLYPALLLGLTQVIGATQRNLDQEWQRVLLVAEGARGEIAGAFAKNRLEAVDPPASGDLRELIDEARAALSEGPEADFPREALKAALKSAGYAAAVVCEEEFQDRMAAARRGIAGLLYDPTDEPSRAARAKATAALEEFQRARREDLKRTRGDEALFDFVERPVAVREMEMATESQKGAYSFAPLLGMLIVIMSLTGAFYPAIDLAAGEKERGTMETLLVAPVPRSEIVLGKFLAVWVIAVVTALLNLLVMGLTFSKVAGMVGGGRIAFSLPASTLGGVTAILIPTAALFSALALALSSLATSYKEGQHYLSPLFLVATPLAMVGLLPNIQIGYALSLVPVANVVLLVKAMLLGGEAVGPALVAAGATAVYALVALAAAVSLFRRESVLFRSGAGRSYDAASLKAARIGLPGEGHALFLFFAVLAAMFFLSGKPPETLGGAVKVFLLSQVAAVLLPTALVAVRARLNLRETFSLRGFRPWLLPALAASGVCTLVLVLWIQKTLMPAREAQGLERVIGMLAESPLLGFFLLAILPPVCEEVLCRGFLLSAFRARYGGLRAVLITAALFGALHLDLGRFPATFLGGLVLGFVCLRTGSIFASILVHALYNGTIALTLYVPGFTGSLEALGPVECLLASVGLAASLLLLARAPRPSPAG